MEDGGMQNTRNTGGESGLGGNHVVETTMTIFKLSTAAMAVSMIGTVVLAWASPVEQPEFTIRDPPTIALIVSWAGMWASLVVCGVWSLLTLKRHESPTGERFYRGNRAVYLMKLFSADHDELTSYEQRLQLAIQALVFGTVVASIPLLMKFDIIGR